MKRKRSILGDFFRSVVAFVTAGFLTALCFLVLPIIQSIGEQDLDTVVLTEAETAKLPPPPEPEPEQEPEPEPEPEEPPPELIEQDRPADLAELEAALNPGAGDGWSTGSYSIDLAQSVLDKSKLGDLFELGGVDQNPRVRTKDTPIPSAKLKRRLKQRAVRVTLIFLVDEKGRVNDPRVESSSDPAFNKLVLSSIKKWRFEPGKRGGEAVAWPVRIPFTFPKG